MRDDIIVTCLTYKRKNPRILKMLEKNPRLTICFGVREDEYHNGFYDEWHGNPQIEFMLLNDVADAADTRNKILDFCYSMDKRYVVQFDDTMENLVCTTNDTVDVNDIIECAIEMMEQDASKPIAFEFVQNACAFSRHKTLIQAWVIDVERLYETDIRFRSIAEVGWDDFVFSYELHAAGFTTIMNDVYQRVGKSLKPWDNEAGGTHVNDSFDVNAQIAKNNMRCAKARDWLRLHYDCDNVYIKQRNVDGYAYDYIHAEWRN